MTNRQQAREAWHDRELLATAAFTWPVQEWRAPERPDPSRDPEYPYWAANERRVMQEADTSGPWVIERYKLMVDDFDPDVNERWITRSWWRRGPSLCSGEGAIYTPEYLARTGAA